MLWDFWDGYEGIWRGVTRIANDRERVSTLMSFRAKLGAHVLRKSPRMLEFLEV